MVFNHVQLKNLKSSLQVRKTSGNAYISKYSKQLWAFLGFPLTLANVSHKLLLTFVTSRLMMLVKYQKWGWSSPIILLSLHCCCFYVVLHNLPQGKTPMWATHWGWWQRKLRATYHD
jgi:hypothetical protein